MHRLLRIQTFYFDHSFGFLLPGVRRLSWSLHPTNYMRSLTRNQSSGGGLIAHVSGEFSGFVVFAKSTSPTSESNQLHQWSKSILSNSCVKKSKEPSRCLFMGTSQDVKWRKVYKFPLVTCSVSFDKSIRSIILFAFYRWLWSLFTLISAPNFIEIRYFVDPEMF